MFTILPHTVAKKPQDFTISLNQAQQDVTWPSESILGQCHLLESSFLFWDPLNSFVHSSFYFLEWNREILHAPQIFEDMEPRLLSSRWTFCHFSSAEDLLCHSTILTRLSFTVPHLLNIMDSFFDKNWVWDSGGQRKKWEILSVIYVFLSMKRLYVRARSHLAFK